MAVSEEKVERGEEVVAVDIVEELEGGNGGDNKGREGERGGGGRTV